MPNPSSSSTSSKLPSNLSKPSKSKKRWTREQLSNALQLLQNLPDPLPATLPPSPPASRPASPVPSKRKLDQVSESDHVKRPRVSKVPDRSHTQQQQQQPPPQTHSQSQYHHQSYHPHPPSFPGSSSSHRAPDYYPAYNTLSTRSEPCEDGEVREDPMPPRVPIESGGSVTHNLPIRRPRRGKGPQQYWDSLHDKYHSAGRMLKYSGDARFWSTYPTSHREYRPLPDPPPPGSSYHKHGGLIARLELVDALLCFTYSLWSKDYSRNSCNNETWATIEAFLGWCRDKWQTEEGTNDAEKAFLGLIYMIEAFIRARKMAYAGKGSDHSAFEIYSTMKAKIASAAKKAEEETMAGALSTKTQTPPMLPSPASIAPANSANSTPTNREDATPNTVNGRSASAAPTAAKRLVKPSDYPIPLPLVPDQYKGVNTIPPMPKLVADAVSAVTVPVGPSFVSKHKEVIVELNAAHYCMMQSQATLTLPNMARHFPNTFARMIYTTLLPSEEHEPDFEDEEGELFWPGQCITGEGLGWVCLMGKAMINEFGKAYGYRGLDGVVHKPEQNSERNGKPSHAQGQNHPRADASSHHFSKTTTGAYSGPSSSAPR